MNSIQFGGIYRVVPKATPEDSRTFMSYKGGSDEDVWLWHSQAALQALGEKLDHPGPTTTAPHNGGFHFLTDDSEKDYTALSEGRDKIHNGVNRIREMLPAEGRGLVATLQEMAFEDGFFKKAEVDKRIKDAEISYHITRQAALHGREAYNNKPSEGVAQQYLGWDSDTREGLYLIIDRVEITSPQ